MRILHTSDWHIGKRLQSKSRLYEQQKTLSELAYICSSGKIDVVLVAGDIFDVSVPSAEAEELFYYSALEIARSSCFVAIAGNHDDPERLSAPRGIARASDIFLLGGLDNSGLTKTALSGNNTMYSGGQKQIYGDNKQNFGENFNNFLRPKAIASGGNGWLRLNLKDEILNLAVLPYPSLSRTEGLSDIEGETFSDKIKSLIDLCCGGFTKDGINIFCSHLFISGSEVCDNELGGAHMLPTTVLPDAVYTALGHIHKPQVVSRSKNAHYSGSILNYSFDDLSDKRYIIIDTDGKRISAEDVSITTGKKPVRLRAASLAEAEELLRNNNQSYVELTYTGIEPLRPSDVIKLKSHSGFCKLNIETTVIRKETANRESRTTAQLFTDFYHKNYGSNPDDSVIELFLKIIAGENI